jgi:transposase
MTHLLATQILEVFFNLQDYSLNAVERSNQEILLFIEKSRNHRCNRCLSEIAGPRYDSQQRKIYIGVLNLTPIYAVLRQYRLYCPACGGIHRESQELSNGKSNYCKDIGQTVIQYTNNMSCSEASRLLHIPERTLREIDKTTLKELESNHIENVPEITSTGVDEVSHKRGHNYGTVVINQDDSKVIWLEKDRKYLSLAEIYDKFEDKFQTLEVVSMDFWRAFEKATSLKFPEASIVYDLFHLARILNRHIDEERRIYQKTLSDEDRKFIKKHTRWILLRRYHNYTEYHKERLQELKEHNERLFEMYLLKEEFLSIFDRENSRIDAKKMIFNWIEMIRKTSFEALKKFAKTVKKKLHNILNWFDHPVSNGKSEGINNVIKTLLKRGYGYKDFEYFRLKVLQKGGYLMVGINA